MCRFHRAWKALDETVQFLDSGVALSELDQRIAFLQLRCRRLVPAGILLQHAIELTRKSVSEIMIPSTAIVSLPAKAEAGFQAGAIDLVGSVGSLTTSRLALVRVAWRPARGPVASR